MNSLLVGALATLLPTTASPLARPADLEQDADGAPTTTLAVEFAAPTRMKAGGSHVQVEAPGYAAPAWGDVDGDGKADLLVGQFRGGSLTLYKGRGEGELAAGAPLQAGAEPATIPGIW